MLNAYKDLTQNERFIFAILYVSKRGAIREKTLRELTGLSRKDVSSILSSLESKGLVERKIHIYHCLLGREKRSEPIEGWFKARTAVLADRKDTEYRQI